MACFKPKHAYYSKYPNPTGKYPIVYPKMVGPVPARADLSRPIDLPCQKCVGCRLDRSAKWAIRCVHEQSLHEESCFITLTYDKQHLPPEGSLTKRHFQLFLKRLRKHLEPKKIRYYMCGEYGEKRGRPHYHAIIFGANFHDRKVACRRNGIIYYESTTITHIWGKGGTQIGDANFKTAAYCARYITKKLTGKRAKEYGNKKPEYNDMSRRPGIAKKWIEKNWNDVYPNDTVIINGKQLKPPKYYDSHYEILNPDRMQQIKANRKEIAEKNKKDGRRLKVMEQIKQAQFKCLKRGYENGTSTETI